MRQSYFSFLFQCHHGVPASIGGGSTSRKAFRLSMPPRRSCFVRNLIHVCAYPEFQCHHGVPAFFCFVRAHNTEIEVSMPPRRSCFWSGFPGPARRSAVSMPPRRSCFSMPRATMTDLIAVSMPPRRSCFGIRAGSPMPPSPPFQCHHGVPASCPGAAPGVPGRLSFQCHHGVPASLKRPEGAEMVGPGFNATTAFLLR